MNAREQLALVEDWLSEQDESLSFGLRNALDALRLYDYALAHPDLGEKADGWKVGCRVAALGYDPLTTPEAMYGRSVKDTGAARATKALESARKLLDSVVFVAQLTDTRQVLRELDAAL